VVAVVAEQMKLQLVVVAVAVDIDLLYLVKHREVPQAQNQLPQ
jgi:hypothetical protein